MLLEKNKITRKLLNKCSSFCCIISYIKIAILLKAGEIYVNILQMKNLQNKSNSLKIIESDFIVRYLLTFLSRKVKEK